MTTSVKLEVRPVSRQECAEFILHIHYAKRWPSISYAFGLYENDTICGVVTYGTPPSSTLRNGIAGKEHANKVLELNRLCLKNNEKNYASELVGKSLRLLPDESIVISFADTSQGHIGYVYQATNFMYCGLSAKRTDWKVKGQEHLHGITIADQFRGAENRAKAIRDFYGDDFYLSPRPRKHRYIYLVGNKYFKKAMQKVIRYPQQPYPKKGN
jgi:hypothetical protein